MNRMTTEYTITRITMGGVNGGQVYGREVGDASGWEVQIGTFGSIRGSDFGLPQVGDVVEVEIGNDEFE